MNNKAACSRLPGPKISFAQTMRAEGEWKVVQRRKPRLSYRYLGTTGSSEDVGGNFKSAVMKVPIFITKVHKETTKTDISDYVLRRTQEKISLEKITFRRGKRPKCIKFLVPETKLPLFLDDKLWPQGIIFRRFINFKPKNNMNGGDTVGGLSKWNE